MLHPSCLLAALSGLFVPPGMALLPGVPAPRPLARAAPPAEIAGHAVPAPRTEGPLIPITRELLERWEIPLERYRALSREAKLELQKDLTEGERARLRRLALIERIAGKGWEKFTTPSGWVTPEGLALIARWEEAQRAKPLPIPVGVKLERKDGAALSERDYARAQLMLGALFDGLSEADRKSLGDELVFDARFRNETLDFASVTNPRTGWTLEFGQLGVDGRHAILGRSPYVNLIKRWESRPESWVDYRIHAQVGLVDLKSRFFTEPRPDPRVGRLFELARGLGVSSEKLESISRHVDYDDVYKTRTMVLTSLLTEFGRAYNLFGPVDFAWTVGNLTKISYIAPNTQFDESAGFRIRLGERGPYLGLFGGVSQNLSPAGSELLRESFTREDGIRPGLYLEQAPHASVGLWGQVPGVSELSYSVVGSQRWNENTTVRQLEGALVTTFLERPLSFSARVSREDGPAIEFSRDQLRAGVEYAFTESASATLSYEKDRIRYGNADVDSEAIMLGLELRPGKKSRLTIDHVFGGEYESRSRLRPALAGTLTKVNETLASALDAADEMSELYRRLRSGLDPARLTTELDRLSYRLGRLDPAALDQLLGELDRRGLSEAQRRYLADLVGRTASPGSQWRKELEGRLRDALGRAAEDADRALAPIDDSVEFFRTHREEIEELFGLLSDQTLWEALAVSAGRAALLKAVEKVDIPLGFAGMSLKVDAPTILAASHILGNRLSPLSPVRRGDIEPWLLLQAGRSLGLGADRVTEEMIVGRLFAMAQGELERALRDRLGADLDRLVAGYASDRQALVDRVLAAVPPPAVEELRRRYGDDLGRLLPANATPEELRRLLTGSVPSELARFLQERFGDDLARAVAELTAWAGDLLRREINRTMIHLLLASEELNRLGVDRGRKAADLSVRMMLSSFERLDERGRDKAQGELRRRATLLADEAAREDAALADKFKRYGRRRLDALVLSPHWPAGLRVEIPEEDWVPLLTIYGDTGLFELIDRLRANYASSPGIGDKTIAIEFGEHSAMTEIRPGSDGIRFVLPAPRKDRPVSAHLLKSLSDYFPDGAAPFRK